MGERWSEGTKLKVAAILQQLAGMGAAFGAPSPILSKWGEANQQAVANLARYYEQKRQEKLAKQANKKSMFGKLLGLAGAVAGGALGGPVAGLIAGGASGLLGSAMSGWSVDPIQFAQLGMGVGGLKTAPAGTQNTGILKNISSQASNIAGVLVKIGGTYMVVDPYTAAVVNMYNEDETQKTGTQSLATITSEGR